jgi:hypothetical protein
MVQSSSSGDAGLSFKNAIKQAADRTRMGQPQPSATDEVLAQLTANKNLFGVAPEVIADLAQTEQTTPPERPHEE